MLLQLVLFLSITRKILFEQFLKKILLIFFKFRKKRSIIRNGTSVDLLQFNKLSLRFFSSSYFPLNKFKIN